MDSLPVIQDIVRARAEAIIAANGSWPCRKGCDNCCRRLADVPQITEPEWNLLRTALNELEPAARHGVRDRIRALGRAVRPVVCPMLDTASGVCLVYDARPVACRTYGFYADRDGVLGCGKIESLTHQNSVVWGNHDSINDRVAAIGRRLSLHEWLRIDDDQRR